MRQAVIIIHGIGEQRPMETLRTFVTGVLAVNRIFSKPDRISDTLELRRLNVLPGPAGENNSLRDGCETDFYELYWQHLMQGTRWPPVLKWLLYFLSHPRKLNAPLFKIWKWVVTIILLMAMATVVVVVVVLPALKLSSLGQWLAGSSIFSIPLVYFGLRLLKRAAFGSVERFFLDFVGDAARYLSPDPPNIEARRAIRTAGLTLLRGLHEDELRRYERIILVGHSLGSVIAYDLITWFWQEQHHLVDLCRITGKRKIVATYPANAPPVPDEDTSPLTELNSRLGDDLVPFRKSQRTNWQKQGDKGLPWRITDLVTLGSPLAHADVLMADGRKDLEQGMNQREFPTCPPKPDDERDDRLLWRYYHDENEERHEVHILHHGAPFAVTRWTNLYFPGDVIGGSVAELFGPGIKDVKLCPDPKDGKVAYSLCSHTHYWKSEQSKARRELFDALNLNEAEQPTCGP